jgi:predicted nucleic acid-binding Zn ribbon protein
MLGELGRRWSEVMGHPLAQVTSPARFDEGVLVVRAQSAAWGAQVQFLAAEVRERANATLGREAVRQVKVVLDRESRP